MKCAPDDIACSVGLKPYRYLRTQYFPLPPLSGLWHWALRFSVKPRISTNVIDLIKPRACELDEVDRLWVLTFDEVYLSNLKDIEKQNEQKVYPFKV